MARQRYIDKETGEIWTCSGCHTRLEDDVRLYHMMKYDDWGSNDESLTTLMTEEEMDARFEFKPWSKPLIDLRPVEPRHPMQIVLVCPECGSPLKVEGGAILTSPVQYEHVCSNKDCKYETCKSSIYSGMYVAVTDKQEKKLNEGTYDEWEDGSLIELREKDLWEFKK